MGVKRLVAGIGWETHLSFVILIFIYYLVMNCSKLYGLLANI